MLEAVGHVSITFEHFHNTIQQCKAVAHEYDKNRRSSSGKLRRTLPLSLRSKSKSRFTAVKVTEEAPGISSTSQDVEHANPGGIDHDDDPTMQI